ncbi:DUF1330 domain-containing protein [Erythrobacter sp. JK5]|uniref:DUF1330 domain-containing protein n=1 Tax=Erythrobacter sp. JK5 TaxID=2829500 RepID=UPI001BA55F94|nr:DUF1330 domain-containing protein [Erythrobacter sp. JK5]QUL36985.1 DUF1330 domain-containing protein [Erythrobacter sp. JK5]
MISPALVLLLQGVPAGAAPPPPASTCDAPVYMVVEGRTLDRDRMLAYGRAIADSEIYQKLGGYYVTMPRPLEVFEGDVSPDYVNLTVRFPCIENARAFWNSRVYQEKILPLRQNPAAGDYTVTIYAEAPLREDMVGRVGDNRFTADFADPEVPQVDKPVVGPDAEGDSP